MNGGDSRAAMPKIIDWQRAGVSATRAIVGGMSGDDEDLGSTTLDSGTERESVPEVVALRKDVDILIVTSTVLGAVVLGLGGLAIGQAVERHNAPASSPPSDRDLTEADLLKAGLHCFSGPAEMGAARQRALAAIDRYRWENKLESERIERGGRNFQMWGPPEAKFPEGLLAISKPSSEDASRCFDVGVPSWRVGR